MIKFFNFKTFLPVRCSANFSFKIESQILQIVVCDKIHSHVISNHWLQLENLVISRRVQFHFILNRKILIIWVLSNKTKNHWIVWGNELWKFVSMKISLVFILPEYLVYFWPENSFRVLYALPWNQEYTRRSKTAQLGIILSLAGLGH